MGESRHRSRSLPDNAGHRLQDSGAPGILHFAKKAKAMRGKATNGPGQRSENPRIEWETKTRKKNKAEEGLEKEESRNKRPEALGTREVRIPVVQAGQCPQVTPHFRPALVLQRPASLWDVFSDRDRSLDRSNLSLLKLLNRAKQLIIPGCS